MQIGYSLINQNFAEITFWGDAMGRSEGVPDVILLPTGDQVHCPTPGPLQDWFLVPRHGQYGTAVGVVSDGTRVTKTFLVTPDMVAAERDRRLALGFNYTFSDARGVQRIGTTPADMIGWGEVTTLANALIASGQPTALINILTNTAPISVTAMEWQSILIAAGQFRQPLWAASFNLEGQYPIPPNYADDSNWG